MIEALINELKIELDALKNNISDDDFTVVMQWVSDEYKNFMMIGRDDFVKTLDLILPNNDDTTPIFRILKDNIDKYGATQAYYRVAQYYI